MIKIEIKNRFTGEIAFTYEKENNQLKMFDNYKFDMWAKLLKLKNEIPKFIEKIKAGEVDGSPKYR